MAAAERLNHDPALPAPTERPHRSFSRGSYVDGITQIGVQIAQALALTHSKGICHCDIKPSNVLITSNGEALLFDFNLSFLTDVNENNAGGTIPYMAPEQLRTIAATYDSLNGDSQPDARSDLFSLEVTLYELLSGQLPFGDIPTDLSKGVLIESLIEKQSHGPRPLHEITPHVNKTLAGVIEKCLSFDPADRPGSAAEFASSLELQLSLKNRIARWIRTHKRIAVPGFVLTAVACCLLMYGIATREPTGERNLRAGYQAYRQNDFAAAVQYFSEVPVSDSKYTDALFARSRAYMQNRQPQLALDDVDDVTRILGVDDARVIAFRAYALGMTGNRMRESIANYDSAIRGCFKSPIIDNNKGYEYFLLTKYDMARKRLTAALDGGQHQQIVYHNLAVLEFASAVHEKRDLDLRYIKKACVVGKLKSAELCLDAASSFAMAAEQLRQRDNLEQISQLKDSTIDYCQQALQLGALPAKLNLVQQLNPEIGDDARFVRLLNSKLTGQPEIKAVHRIDPLEHLPEPIGFDG